MNGKIYMIKNSIDEKVYIGQTIRCVQARFKQHLKLAKSSQKQLIYKAIAKKGKDKFFVETLEDKIDSYHSLNLKEESYIRQYNSLAPNGYNLCPGGAKWRRKSKIDELTQQKVIASYQSGKSSRTISSETGIAHRTILDLLERNNIPRRKKTCRLPDRTSVLSREYLKKLYITDGLSSYKIALIVRIDDSSIRKLIRKFGLSRI